MRLNGLDNNVKNIKKSLTFHTKQGVIGGGHSYL